MSNSTYTFEVLSDFFYLPKWKDATTKKFGLQNPDGWRGFTEKIENLKASCRENESIKVFYTARHGQAEHNAMSGTPFSGLIIEPSGKAFTDAYLAWNNQYKKYCEDLWDPSLTPHGMRQTEATGQVLESESKAGMPIPEAHFVSWSTRSGQTAGNLWGWTTSGRVHENDRGCGLKARAMKALREPGRASCDLPSTEAIHEFRFPTFMRPDKMPEKRPALRHQDTSTTIDETKLGTVTLNAQQQQQTQSSNIDEEESTEEGPGLELEGEEELLARVAGALDEIMENSRGKTYVSVTSHHLVLNKVREYWKIYDRPNRGFGDGEMRVHVTKATEHKDAAPDKDAPAQGESPQDGEEAQSS